MGYDSLRGGSQADFAALVPIAIKQQHAVGRGKRVRRVTNEYLTLRPLSSLCLSGPVAVQRSLLLRLTATLISGVIGLIGADAVCGKLEQDATAAQTAPSVPPYERRGDEVEAHYRVYRERLESFYELLSTRVTENAPDLYPKLEAARPKPVRHGYQTLPKLVPDPPALLERPRAKPAWYSWPWTERLIELQMAKIGGLAAELDRVPDLTPPTRRAVCEELVAEYPQLAESERTIDAHIQYNRLWQPAIAHNLPAYDRQTALYHAVLERQAIVDALSAADDAALHTALSGSGGIDSAKARGALETDLRKRGKTLSREIQEAADQIALPPFLRIEHPTSHRWIVHVHFYTDIEDAAFVQAFKAAVEGVWRLRDGDDEFGVQLSIAYVPATRLYGERLEGHLDGRVECIPPGKGEQIDINEHVALFPKGGGVLTTGAISTHVTGRAIALGPHDITPHVLAHEFGHILGFKDLYIRGYQDLGADGYQVMEVGADPNDIMGAPGTGPVLRRHFEKVIALYQRERNLGWWKMPSSL